uniref:Mercuric transport protein periplasmic component (Periplasmic mercury ion-binding protein) (Mercury scavenger protein) n=1 Tax=mine drainage metagenome TaxID=410659 RepID=E6PZP6_9ZZZZ
MRKLLASLLLSLPLAALAAAPRTAVLDVKNMTCPVCPITIRKALEKTPGVLHASVDYSHKTASVQYDPDRTNVAALIKATTNAGFPATDHATTQNAATPKAGTQK